MRNKIQMMMKKAIIEIFSLRCDNNQILIDFQSEIESLGNLIVIPQTTQQKVKQDILFNDIMIYSMIGISGLSLFTGNVDIFQFIRSIIIVILYHIYVVFISTSFDLIFKYLHQSIIQTWIIFKQRKYLDLQRRKFTFLKQNQRNFKQTHKISFICQMLKVATFLFYAHQLLILFPNYYPLINWSLFITFYFKNNYTYLRIDTFYSKKDLKLCKKFRNEYFSFEIFKVYQAILHQFIFSVLLQYPDYSFDSPLMILNSLNAIIGLIFMLYVSLQLLQHHFYQDSVSHFWVAHFKSFQIYKIVIYIFLIVKAIDYPEIQSILLSMSSLFYLGYLLKFQPLQSKYEYSKLITRESLFALNNRLIFDFSFNIEQHYALLFEWVHICFFSLMFVSILTINLIECIKTAWINYKRKQDLLPIKEQQKCYVNKLQKFIEFNLNDQNFQSNK